MAPLLEVRDLAVVFQSNKRRTEAVRNLSYTLARGETLAIVGESGSGKSVSALALLGLLAKPAGRVTSGTARFEGRDLLQMPERELERLRGERITMIFQEPMTSLNPVLTIGRQLTEGLMVHKGLGHAAATARAVEMLDVVGLPEPKRQIRRYPHQLSGGMRQRVMIAMAMASEPAILIADEPTTALDVTIQAQILDLMRDLKRKFDTAVILITHDMGVVAETADRVVVMYQGAKVEEGPVARLFAEPREAYTRRLLAAVPRLGSLADTDRPQRFDAAGAVKPAAPVPAQPHPLLEARGLTKRFGGKGGTLAMDDVGFALGRSETLALVGESGSGKSTTGRAVLRLIEPDIGEIRLDGHDIREHGRQMLRRARREMQMIFQDPFAALNPRMSAGRLVAEPMRIHGIAAGSELDDRTAELFARVGLERDHLRRYPHEFSGGQRQRLCIARALGVGPKLIAADEPTSALDVSVQAQVIDLMLELQEERGLSYLFISHDMAVVERMSHRVAVMHQGRIVELGPRRDVLGDPRHPYTKALLAAVPVPDPTRMRGALPKLDVETLPRGPLEEVAAGHLVAAA
ncbi:MAG: ABC transporter ATP-binding protein [Alphaproteobacteria bacterium]